MIDKLTFINLHSEIDNLFESKLPTNITINNEITINTQPPLSKINSK
jgi:hypothetical protein